MHAKAPLAVLVAILSLAVGAGVLVTVGGRDQGQERARAKEYQELVGGLGFGPVLDLSVCANSFDPRVCPRCGADLGPVPGGGSFCPQHACSVLYYPPLDPAR
ncbi:MAG TPA: hypothetical protein VG013_05595 [Gemmataceae bacterium]|nr:hypothetical protein [Gemmataceae bacterium]